MKTLHLRKCKTEAGWEVVDFSIAKTGAQILWSPNKKLLLRMVSAYLKSVSTVKKPTSLKVHGADGKFKEERTYPKAADPTRSKG